MLSIGEVATHCDVTVRTIRHYHQMGLHELRDNPTFVPRSIEAYVHRLQEVGIPERWVAHERDSWILTHLLCPEWASRWLSMITGLMADPELTALTLEVVAAEHWDPDDPRIEDLARRTADFNDRHLGTALLDADAWTLDQSVMELLEAYAHHRYTTPALKALNARVTELMSAKWSTR